MSVQDLTQNLDVLSLNDEKHQIGQYFTTNIDLKKRLKSFVSVGRAIFNINSDWANHLNQGNLKRKPYPYLMFKGAPNKLDHNYLGYRIKEPITDQTINIALFGGSTGYGGNPPIIDLVTNRLN